MTSDHVHAEGRTDHSGSVTLLRPDGTHFPGSPFTGGGLPGPWAAVVDGNDNVWISNFAIPDSPIVQLCGVRTETCPPGMNTGDQISPPGGYVGGGLQMQTDIAIDPAGNVWAMNNWQDIASCIGKPNEALSTRCGGQGVVSSTAWRSQCARRRSGRHGRSERASRHAAWGVPRGARPTGWRVPNELTMVISPTSPRPGTYARAVAGPVCLPSVQ